MAVKASKVKPPKYTIANIAQLMKLLATSVRQDIGVQLPKGCTHAIYHRSAKAEGFYAVWPSNTSGSIAKEMDVEAYDGDVVFTDAWGVKCLAAHGGRKLGDDVVILKLLSSPQEIETDKKRIPKRRDPLPEGQTDLGLISDAILSQSRRTATGRMKPDTRPTEERTKLKPAAFFTKGTPPGGKKAMACINDNGRLLKWEPKTAGYWRQVVNYSADDTLPFPVITTARGYVKSAFLNQLKIAERAATQRAYRGWSNNRWDGTANGSSEFNLNGWKWPSGYFTYLEAGVLPSREFYKFIMGKDLETLPSYS